MGALMRSRFNGSGATALAAALVWGVTGCGGWDTTDDWDGGAARAVARHVDATIPDGRMVVLGEIGAYDGEALPWSVRQSLTTAGFEIGDSTSLRDPAVFMLVFDASDHDGDAWDIRTRLLHRDAAPVPGTWRVLCHDDECTVEGPPGSPAPTPAPELEPELYPEPAADTSAFTAPPPPGSGPPPDSLP
jgi:hypothetical protein